MGKQTHQFQLRPQSRRSKLPSVRIPLHPHYHYLASMTFLFDDSQHKKPTMLSLQTGSSRMPALALPPSQQLSKKNSSRSPILRQLVYHQGYKSCIELEPSFENPGRPAGWVGKNDQPGSNRLDLGNLQGQPATRVLTRG